MDHWYNWPQVVWDVIVILLLSSLWFIWNNCSHQIPSSYTSMSSNIKNCPITPELLYYTNGRHEIMEGGTWQTSQIFRASSPRSPLRDAGELWSSAAAAATGIKGFSQLHTSPRLAPPVHRPSWHSQHNISHFQIHFFNSVCPLNNLSMFMLNFFREMWTSEIISHLLKCIDITGMLCFVPTNIHSKHTDCITTWTYNFNIKDMMV